MIQPIALAAAAMLLVSCASSIQTGRTLPLKTAGKVDLSRYSGTWYEIARYPQWFQRDCSSATAEYSTKPDGSIRVVNTCIREDGTRRSIEGSALPVDSSNNRLQVRFANRWYARLIPIPEEGNYWMIDLTPDYRHVIVGTPDRKSLWFLSRSTTIRRTEFERQKKIAREQGFDPRKLVVDGHTQIVP
jgi:apolipoprotein D and lipocalin family protein